VSNVATTTLPEPRPNPGPEVACECYLRQFNKRGRRSMAMRV
jgi:hypothetical protein